MSESSLLDTYVPVLILAAYGVMVGGLWLVLSREWRNRFLDNMKAMAARIAVTSRTGMARIDRAASGAASKGAENAKSLRQAIAAKRHTLALAHALLLIPALGTLLLAQYAVPEPYEDMPMAVSPVIASLLQGERLAPPSPLPPELFITKELDAERSQIASASRQWTMLESDFRQRLLTVFHMMANHGYQMVLIEGYRSPERQAALALLGPHVTNAGAFQSYHQFGLAADSGFYRDGKIVISERDPWAMEGYRLYGHYAEAVGLTWGGRWKLLDLGHVELRRPEVLARR